MMAKKSQPGPVKGSLPSSQISPFSTVTRFQEESDNPAGNTSIDIFVSHEDANCFHPLKLTLSWKGFPETKAEKVFQHHHKTEQADLLPTHSLHQAPCSPDKTHRS